GRLLIAFQDQIIGEVDTSSPEKTPKFASFPLPAGAREITLSVTSGSIRLFGVSFERHGPGVIYNSLGLNGGHVQAIVRYFEPNQWAEQLRHQHPDLVIVNYGTNESGYAKYVKSDYAGELREVMRRVKAAVPDASVLIMSPMDRGERDANGVITTLP